MTVGIEQAKLTDEDRKTLGLDDGTAEETPGEESATPLEDAANNPEDHDPNKIPSWVTNFPTNFPIPPGKEVVFVWFKANLTDRPDLGDRWCMLWPLSDLEETNATKLARGDQTRVFKELTKATIRLIDGMRPDWTGKPNPGTYSVNKFWNEMGAKYRARLLNLYLKMHSMTDEESADFFLNCVAIRTVKIE